MANSQMTDKELKTVHFIMTQFAEDDYLNFLKHNALCSQTPDNPEVLSNHYVRICSMIDSVADVETLLKNSLAAVTKYKGCIEKSKDVFRQSTVNYLTYNFDLEAATKE